MFHESKKHGAKAVTPLVEETSKRMRRFQDTSFALQG